jgi:hypothetical protein
MSGCALSAEKAANKNNTFAKTIPQIQKALVNKDQKYISQHVALESIIRYKVDQYVKKAQQGSMISKIGGFVASLGEGGASKLIAKMALSSYNKSSLSDRQYFLNQVKINRVTETKDKGSAAGSFMGKPLGLSGICKNGQWIIVAVESPLINLEIKNALKSLHLLK